MTSLQQLGDPTVGLPLPITGFEVSSTTPGSPVALPATGVSEIISISASSSGSLTTFPSSLYVQEASTGVTVFKLHIDINEGDFIGMATWQGSYCPLPGDSLLFSIGPGSANVQVTIGIRWWPYSP